MQKIELHPAFTFDCDQCGRECVTRMPPMTQAAFEQLDDDERHELLERLEISGWDDAVAGRLLRMAPLTVRCSHCGCEYQSDFA